MAEAIFYWSPEFTAYDLGWTHPLKPERLELTYRLIDDVGLFDRPEVSVRRPVAAEDAALGMAHSPGYLAAVKSGDGNALHRYGFGTGDNPIFPNMYAASALYTGASLQAAQAIYNNEAAAAFNIAGGLHHAHWERAAGFCVFNDPVVAIAWILKETGGEAKVVYLDIDAHHGDGVQEAFYRSPKVLTISVHESCRTLFPGTGRVDEIGKGEGKGYAVNLPLAAYTDDETYLKAFDAVAPPLVEAFGADFLVSQLGVDAHYMDPLTHLSLTTAGYEALFARIKKLAKGKWIALGGGGYSLEAVPRAWTLAFAEMAGVKLPDLSASGICLRDREAPRPSADEMAYVREFAARSVAGIREKVFPYHGL